ncbi:MAG: PEP/pyruvate-binding domain-containing protein [Rhodomicrobium sp.]
MEESIFPITDRGALDTGRVGPKAANLVALGRAGLPIPDGFCIDANAYRYQLASLGVDLTPRHGLGDEEVMEARMQAIEARLALLSGPIVPAILEPLLASRQALLARANGAPLVVRSSSLVEDRYGSSFAGQFESYLGLDNEADFLTAVRACWAALWSPRVLRYMLNQLASPAETAMGVLVQPLVAAVSSGGGLSRTGHGEMLLTATWGLGSTIAQGEVVPDSYVLTREGKMAGSEAGRKNHSVGCKHHGSRQRSVEAHVHRGDAVREKCLTNEQAMELGEYLLKAEEVMGAPVEIEWSRDETGFKLLQSRPLHMEQVRVPDEIWSGHPKLSGQPSGVGWGTGRACVVSCECELSRVGPGDILVTKVAGPALGRILPRVAGVIAELGGSTSHLASLARERGIPMVLGVHNATQRIPDGKHTAVDGVTGIVRWMA